MISNAVLIAGPTASGKSSYAIDRAVNAVDAGQKAVIINTDSMQVYDGLRLITARPSKEDEARVPHHLFGFIDPAHTFSTGEWLKAVEEILTSLDEKTTTIFVGGTGLYFKALTEGFATIPDIPDDIRESLRKRAALEDILPLYQELEAKDPDYAGLIEPSDGQRTLRALEVLYATGKSILWWQDQPTAKPLLANCTLEKTIILPERDDLYQRINQRFKLMIERGAIDEVQALLSRKLAPDLPAMKAIGVREIAAHLAGDINLEEAIEKASQESRRYAKRQMTWLRNQMGEDWVRLQNP